MGKAEPLIADKTVLWAARVMGRSMRTLSESPGDVGALRLRAAACHVFGLRTGLPRMHETALSDYEAMLRDDPKDAGSLSRIGRVQACLGRRDDALESYRRALELAPSAQMRIEHGKFLLAVKRHAEAASEFGHATGLDPKNPAAHAWRGEALLADGRRVEALACLQQAAALSPGSASAHNRLAVELLRAGRGDEARAHFDSAVSLDPRDATLVGSVAGKVADSPGSLDALGHTDRIGEYMGHGQSANTVAMLQQRLAIDPHDLEAYLGLGLAFLARKLYLDAREALLWAALADSNSLEAHFNLCRALSLLGRHEEAMRSLETAANLDPADAGFHLGQANALCRLGLRKEAIPACQSAIARDPADPEAHKTMAAICTSVGNHGGALASIGRAIGLDSHDAISHVHRGYVLHSVGRVSDALGAFYQAVRLNPDMRSLVPRP